MDFGSGRGGGSTTLGTKNNYSHLRGSRGGKFEGERNKSKWLQATVLSVQIRSNAAGALIGKSCRRRHVSAPIDVEGSLEKGKNREKILFDSCVNKEAM